MKANLNYCFEKSVCPICHKVFYSRGGCDWAFKVNNRRVCSWTCLQRFRKAQNKKLKNKVKGLDRENGLSDERE